VRQSAEKPTSAALAQPLRIVTSSRRGCVHVASKLESGWISEGIELPHSVDDEEIACVMPIPALRSFLAVRQSTTDLVDIQTSQVMHTFRTNRMKPDSLRYFHSARKMTKCGSIGLKSFSLAYTSIDSGDCVLHSFVPRREGNLICFHNNANIKEEVCNSWLETVEQIHHMPSPGEWETVDVGVLVGVRKRDPHSVYVARNTLSPRTAPYSGSGLRHRHNLLGRAPSIPETQEDTWEAWMLTSKGETATTPLITNNEKTNGYDHQLLVHTLGPITKVGKRSIAVGFGNVIKFITVGAERFNDTENTNEDAAFATIGRRRKTLGPRKRSYVGL